MRLKAKLERLRDYQGMAFRANDAASISGKLADAIYVRYQIDAVRVVQLFDLGQGNSVPRISRCLHCLTNNELWNRSRQRTPTTPNPIHQRQY